MRPRAPIVVDSEDQTRIAAALDRWSEQEGFVGLRTRAFVFLLWDGALRTGAAIWLDIEDVVRDPAASRIHVVQRAVLRPCEGNKYRGRSFEMTDRTRAAIADYLRVARSDGWLANGSRLKGPLWIATQPQGEQKRMSQRTAVQAWHSFIGSVKGLSDVTYQLDDMVLTGRVAFARAAEASPELISQHAGIGTKAATRYSSHLTARSSTRDVISQLNQQHKRKA
jgi:integrase